MTPDEIIAELESLATVSRGPDGYATMNELADAAEATGKSRSAVARLIKAAQKAGRLQVMRVPRPNIEGIPQRIVGYRILPGA